MGVVQKSHPGADVRDGLFLTQQGAGHANPAAVDVHAQRGRILSCVLNRGRIL